MICALTVRELKPGTFDEFRERFMEGADDAPEGLVRFNMVRNSENPNEVITFGLFEGTVDQMRAGADAGGYDELLQKIAPFVAAVKIDGLYEVMEDRTPEDA